jgi:integrase
MLVSLTTAICDHARPEPREYILRDARQPGLGLRVRPCGARSWIVRQRIGDRQVKHSLGSYPAIGVKLARKTANALLAGDVKAPDAASIAPSFEAFQVEYESQSAVRHKPSGLRTYRSYKRLQLLPAFSGKKLDAISRPDVISWFQRYSATSPGGANRALDILSHMFGQALKWGYLPAGWINPAARVRRNRRKIVGTFLSPDQMARLGVALATRMEQGCIAASLLRLLSLTGLRVGEAIDLEWRDILSNRLRLRDSKTGPRDVPMGAPVARFLEAHRARCRRSFPKQSKVFPLPIGYEYEAIRRVWFDVRKYASLPGKLRMHDLRHSFASHAVMSGETLLTTSRLLGHRRVQTTARYAHLADDTLLDTAETIGALILSQAGHSVRN